MALSTAAHTTIAALAVFGVLSAHRQEAPHRAGLPPVRVDAGRFRIETGATWPWQGFSDFALFQRYAHGDRIEPLLDERHSVGANVLRVFTMFAGTPGRADDQGIGAASGLGHLDPRTVPDYDARLTAFVDLLAAHGLRVELVCLADNLQLKLDERAQVARIVRAVGARPNVFLEIANEPFKNVRTQDLGDLIPPAPRPPTATGESTHLGDYVTSHSDRGADWIRSAHTLTTIRERVALESGRQVPVVADEPLGASDTDTPGRRSRRADDFRTFAALARISGAGATFHSDDGIASVPLSAIQKASATAFFDGLTWAPADLHVQPAKDGAGPYGPFCKHLDDVDWCVTPGAPPEWRMPAAAGCALESRIGAAMWKWRCRD